MECSISFSMFNESFSGLISNRFFSFIPFEQASKNSDDMRDIASRICRDYLTGAWKTISSADIQLKRIRYVILIRCSYQKSLLLLYGEIQKNVDRFLINFRTFR